MTGRPEREVPKSLDTAINRISRYANRGSFRQFYNEMVAKLASDPEIEISMPDESSMVFSKVSKSGGFLGIGVRKVKTPILKLVKKGDDVLVDSETTSSTDEAFTIRIASMLKPH